MHLKNLKTLREKRKMTSKKLAREAGISYNILIKIERSGIKKLKKLLDKKGITTKAIGIIFLLFIIIFTLVLAVSSCESKGTQIGDSVEPANTEAIETINRGNVNRQDKEIVTTDMAKNEAGEVEPIIEPDDSIISDISDGEEERLKDLSIRVGNNIITLLDWDNEINLYELLGKPLSEDIQELGQVADTFAGSFIKTLNYDGLRVRLFSPKDNGKTFWVMEIVVSGGVYKTFRGIKVGDSLQEVKEKYPHVSKVKDGRVSDNNCAYEIVGVEGYNYLRFEILNGTVSEIRIFHEMP